MPVPQTYTTGAKAVASYNFSDIDEGTGIVTYKAYSSEKNSGEQYGLTTTDVFSHLVSSSGSVASSATYDIDFDTGVQNFPRIIKGTATVTVTWKVTNSSGSNSNFIFAKLRKWDGTTETELAESSGAIIDSASGLVRTTNLKITPIEITKILQDEQIRLTVGVTGVTAGNSPRAHIAHDPQNRDDDYFSTGNFDTTTLKFDCPFKIEI